MIRSNARHFFRRYRPALAAGVALALSACATPVAVTSNVITEFNAGRAQPTCQVSCLWGWLNALPTLDAQYRTQDWNGMRSTVLALNYKDDLSYFYMARSAEGLGFFPAAKVYYERSLELSASPLSTDRCASMAITDPCNGLDVAVLARAGIARIEAGARPDDWINPPRRR